MMVLVIGGSGSGKSAYAEEVAVSLYRQTISSKEKPSAGKKYYLATMHLITLLCYAFQMYDHN